jgi:hypothetical protein
MVLFRSVVDRWMGEATHAVLLLLSLFITCLPGASRLCHGPPFPIAIAIAIPLPPSLSLPTRTSSCK